MVGGARQGGAVGAGAPQCLSAPRAWVAHSFSASDKHFCFGTALAFSSTLTQLIP